MAMKGIHVIVAIYIVTIQVMIRRMGLLLGVKSLDVDVKIYGKVDI